MNITGAMVIFTIIWWVTFFAVLPWGVRSQWEDEGEMPKGTDPGAPVEPQLKKKALRTTWITAILFVIVVAIIQSGIINLRQ